MSGSGGNGSRSAGAASGGGGGGSSSSSSPVQVRSNDSTIAPHRMGADERSGASSSASYLSNDEAFWDARQQVAHDTNGAEGSSNLQVHNGGAYGNASSSSSARPAQMYAFSNASAPQVDEPGAAHSRGPPLADDLGMDKLSLRPRNSSRAIGQDPSTSGQIRPEAGGRGISNATQEINRSASEVHPHNSLDAIADEIDSALQGFSLGERRGSEFSAGGSGSIIGGRRGSAFSSGGTSSTAHQRVASRSQTMPSTGYYPHPQDIAQQQRFAGYPPHAGNPGQAPQDSNYFDARQQYAQPGYDPAMYQQPGGWYGQDGAYYDESQGGTQVHGYNQFGQMNSHQGPPNGYFGGSPPVGSVSQPGQAEGGPPYMGAGQSYGMNYPVGLSSPPQGPYGMYSNPMDAGPQVPAGYGTLHRQMTGMSVSSMRSNNSAAARRKSKDQAAKQTQQSLPFNKAFVDEYRQRMKGDPDPEAQFAYARYLIEAAKKVADPRDGAKQARKYRDALLSESLKLIKRLATTGTGLGKPPFAEAQFFLANCFGNGSLGLQVDHEKAYNLYVQASKQNHAAATYRTAVCNEVGAGTRRDHHRAVLFYRKASALGDTAGMYKLGMVLLNGLLGQPRNIREAIVWLKRAAGQADEDNPHALHELGLLHEKPNNNVVPVDEAYARELFTQAAQLGYAPSQFKLGSAYEYGSLTCPVDPRRSIAWYTKAAGKYDGESELALSGWYLTGSEGVLKQSDSEAYLWARRAATKGIPKAEYAVGYYSEVGIGVTADVEEAKRWYMRAAAQGNKRAMMRLTELKQQRSNARGGKRGARPTRKDAERECIVM